MFPLCKYSWFNVPCINVVLFCLYNVYCLGNILPVNVLMGILESILVDQSPADPYPIGVLTTQNRDKWAEIRDHMTKSSSRNQQSFRELDTSIFVLSLDEEELGPFVPEVVAKQYLHHTNRLALF